MNVVLLLLLKNEKNDNINNDEILVNIKDTGTGIDPEILPKLFTKFATKSYSRNRFGIIHIQEDY